MTLALRVTLRVTLLEVLGEAVTELVADGSTSAEVIATSEPVLPVRPGNIDAYRHPPTGATAPTAAAVCAGSETCRTLPSLRGHAPVTRPSAKKTKTASPLEALYRDDMSATCPGPVSSMTEATFWPNGEIFTNSRGEVSRPEAGTTVTQAPSATAAIAPMRDVGPTSSRVVTVTVPAIKVARGFGDGDLWPAAAAAATIASNDTQILITRNHAR